MNAESGGTSAGSNYQNTYVRPSKLYLIMTNASTGSKLGIIIEPSQVRLIPGPDDPYIWKVLPEKGELFSRIFSKNISDHSIGAYKELCEGVGKTFEAVRVTATAKINSAKAQGVTISVNACKMS